MAMAWQGNGMVCVNQTRPHCVNQMGKTQSKPLAERLGRGTAGKRHGMCESALIVLITPFLVFHCHIHIFKVTTNLKLPCLWQQLKHKPQHL
jgi:hypothetical protein